MRQLFVFILMLIAIGTKAQKTLDNTYVNKCAILHGHESDTLTGSFTLEVNWQTFPDLGLIRLGMEFKPEHERAPEFIEFTYCSADPIDKNVTLHRECNGDRIVIVDWELRRFKLIQNHESKVFWFE